MAPKLTAVGLNLIIGSPGFKSAYLELVRNLGRVGSIFPSSSRVGFLFVSSISINAAMARPIRELRPLTHANTARGRTPTACPPLRVVIDDCQSLDALVPHHSGRILAVLILETRGLPHCGRRRDDIANHFTIVRRSSTDRTPATDQAALSAASRSSQLSTCPSSEILLPSRTSTLIASASRRACRASASSIFFLMSDGWIVCGLMEIQLPTPVIPANFRMASSAAFF